MLLFIDNFDSFTYNLIQYFEILGAKTKVVRNQDLTIEQCLDLHPDSIVIGPGPGAPSQAGISKNLINNCAGRIPLLGICLGHQAIAEVYGGKVIRAQQPIHGKTSAIFHHSTGLFTNLPQGFLATRYHSLLVEKESLPSCLTITAETKDGEIMGVCHKEWNVHGIQFHPESILTEHGFELLRNFLDNLPCSR